MWKTATRTALLALGFAVAGSAQIGLNCATNLVDNPDFAALPPFTAPWVPSGGVGVAGLVMFDVDNDGTPSWCFRTTVASNPVLLTQPVGQLQSGSVYEVRANIATNATSTQWRRVRILIEDSSGSAHPILTVNAATGGVFRYPVAEQFTVAATDSYTLAFEFTNFLGNSTDFYLDDVELLEHVSMAPPSFGFTSALGIGTNVPYAIRAQPLSTYVALLGFEGTVACSGVALPNIVGDFLLASHVQLSSAQVMNPSGVVTGTLPVPNDPSMSGLPFAIQPVSVTFPSITIGFARAYSL